MGVECNVTKDIYVHGKWREKIMIQKRKKAKKRETKKNWSKDEKTMCK